MFNRIGDGQAGAVGTEGAALGEEGGKPAVPLGKVGRPGVHHPQAEALDLLGPQPLPIPYAVFIPVALQIGGLGQGVHRVGHGAPQPPEPLLSGHAGVLFDDPGVVLKLIHPHVLHLGAHRRNPPGGHEHEHIAVKQLIRADHINLREGVVRPRQADLPHLELPPGGDLVAEVADPDGVNHIPAQQLQPGEEGGAHVPDGQDVDPLLPPAGALGQDGHPAGAADVHRGEPPLRQGGGQGRVHREVRQAGGVQHLQPVEGLQLARVSDLEGAPAQHRVPLHQIEYRRAGGGLSLGIGQIPPVRGQDLPILFVIIKHNITPHYHFPIKFLRTDP